MEREEEEAALEERDRAPERASTEVDEADALDQVRPVQSTDEDERDRIGDLPEADAIEQARGVGGDEEDERR